MKKLPKTHAVIYLFLSLTTLSIPSFSETEYLSTSQLNKFISGNSLSGVYDGKKYKQNMLPGGNLRFIIEGNGIIELSWFVNDKAQYCEDWTTLNWGISCYRINTPKPNSNEFMFLKNDGTTGKANWHNGLIDLKI